MSREAWGVTRAQKGMVEMSPALPKIPAPRARNRVGCGQGIHIVPGCSVDQWLEGPPHSLGANVLWPCTPQNPQEGLRLNSLLTLLDGNLEGSSNSKKKKGDVPSWLPYDTTTHGTTEETWCGAVPVPGSRPGHPQPQTQPVFGNLQNSEFSGIIDLAHKIITGWIQEIKKHKTSPHEQCSSQHLLHLPLLNLVV